MRKILLFLFLIISSCSDDKIYTEREMWNMAKEEDPTVELVGIPNHEIHRRILCSQYKVEGCIPNSGRRIKVRLVELIVIGFETEEQAKKAADLYGQYYARNWLFDDVAGEPVLESFVKKVYNAKKGVRKETSK